VLLHALRLEAEDWRMVGRLAKRIVSITTDYGVEAGLQSVPAMDIGLLHPHWTDAADTDAAAVALAPNTLMDDVAGAAEPPVPEEESPERRLTFQHSLAIPGCLHVLHNALDDLTDTLPDWEYWSQRAKAVSRFLSEHQSKGVLLAQCFAVAPASIHKPKIDKFHAVIYDKRFGSLMGFVTQVLQIKGILTQYFEPARFRRAEPNQVLGEIGSVSMDLVCEASWPAAASCSSCSASCRGASAIPRRPSTSTARTAITAAEGPTRGRPLQQGCVLCVVAGHLIWLQAW
jgi:hypothetical protein